MMNISAVSKTNTADALALLQSAALPVEDINDDIELFVLEQDHQLLGTIGIQHDGTIALLRSLSVDEKHRGKGYGEALVNFLEQSAKEKGIQTIYLLTTTAESFFGKRGYTSISRDETPYFIQQTTEFSSVCPASAVVMKKVLK